MNGWDPMMGDYNNSYFNSYSQGVGRNLSTGSMGNAHIFVDNFPVDVGEDGLVNIFSDFGTVVRAELKSSNREDKKHTFGFVIMADPACAAEAISVLNGHRFHFSPRPIKVQPAITSQERERRKLNKQMERDIMGPSYPDNMSDSFSMADEPRNSFQRLPLEYRHPNLRLMAGFPCENFNGNMGGAWGYEEQGPRLPLGRGRIMGPPSRGPGPSFGGRGQRLQEYISQGPVGGRDSLGLPGPSRGPPRVSPSSCRKQCIQCGNEDSTNRCSRCKMYYCSFECQKKDWPNHKNICIDVSLHHETLYGADPLETMSVSSKESRRAYQSNASVAQSGKNREKNERQKDNGMSGRRDNEMSGRKDKQKKAKPHNRGYSSEIERDKESSNRRQNTQINKSNTSQISNDKDTKGSGQRNENKKKNDAKSKVGHNEKGGERNRKDKRPEDNIVRDKVNGAGDASYASPEMDALPVKTEVEETKGSGQRNENRKRNEEKCKNEKDVDKNKKESVEGDVERDDKVNGSGDAPFASLELDSLPVGTEVECYLGHYENPENFWVIKKENMVSFLEATQIFTECIQDVPDIIIRNIKQGDMCCLLYCGEWSRARVLKIHEGVKATVAFSDYGNKDEVNISDLKPLVPEMRQFPAQAIRCSVYGVKTEQKSSWSNEAIEAGKKWMGEPLTKELTLNCHSTTKGKHLVDISSLSETPVNLKDLLLIGNYAEEFTESGKAKEVKRTITRYQADVLESVCSELKEGQIITINIMVFKNAGCFVGQALDKMASLPKLEAFLEELKLEEGIPYSPVSAGELVLARYSVDNKWYRSEVSGIKNDNFSVTYLDYGNEQTVKANDIRQIPEKCILEYPRYALTFGIQGFDRLATSKSMVDEFASLLEEYTLDTGVWQVKILEKKGSLLLVDFMSKAKKQTLSEALKKKGDDASPHSPEKKASSAKAAISPMKSDSPSKPSPRWADSVDSPPKPSPRWADSVDSPPKPSQRWADSVDSPEKAVTSTPSVISQKKPPLKFSPPHKANDSEDGSVQAVCQIGMECLPSSTTMTNVTVFYVVSLEKFYVGPSDKQVSLNEMMLELNTNVDSLTRLKNAQKGSVATLKFDDGLWYRVRVLSIDGDTCSVFFFDYGNSETLKTDSLHALPDLVSTTPAQAIHCSLDVKSNKLLPDALKQLKLLEEHSVDAKVLSKEKDSYVLQLFKPDGSPLLESENKENEQKKIISTAPTPMLSDIEIKEPSDKDMDVHCAYFKSIEEFYCLCLKDIPGVTEMSEKLDSFCKTMDEGVYQEPILGGLYGCYFENQWYRCSVEEITDSCVKVRYIDFGNTEMRNVTDLKPLDHDLLVQPVSLFKCKLHGVQLVEGGKNNKEIDEYNVILQERLQLHESHVKIEGKEGDLYSVSLSLSSADGQSVDIASDLVGVRLAKWIDSPEPQQQSQEPEEEESEDEDDKKMKELMKELEAIKMRKKKKAS